MAEADAHLHEPDGDDATPPELEVVVAAAIGAVAGVLRAVRDTA